MQLPDSSDMIDHRNYAFISTVLVFRIGSLGDTVVALPALREIRRRNPQSRIVFLTNTPVDGGVKAASSTHVLAGTGLIERYIEYPHGSLSLRRLLAVIMQIRAVGPTICYCLNPTRTLGQALRDRLFFALSGVHKIVGVRRSEVRRLPPQGADVLWESEAKRMMRAIGSPHRPLSLEDFSLVLSSEERTIADQALLEAEVKGPFMVMSLGSKLPVKDWGDQRWSECLRRIGENAKGLTLVAIGSEIERERSTRILRSWCSQTANLCGRLAPRQSAAVIERARLFLGHDSGPMHLASSVGTSIVSIFSARNMPGIWFPFGQEANAFYKNVPCRNCCLDNCVDRKQRCMTEIEPSDVSRMVLDILFRVSNTVQPEVAGKGISPGALALRSGQQYSAEATKRRFS